MLPCGHIVGRRVARFRFEARELGFLEPHEIIDERVAKALAKYLAVAQSASASPESFGSIGALVS